MVLFKHFYNIEWNSFSANFDRNWIFLKLVPLMKSNKICYLEKCFFFNLNKYSLLRWNVSNISPVQFLRSNHILSRNFLVILRNARWSHVVIASFTMCSSITLGKETKPKVFKFSLTFHNWSQRIYFVFIEHSMVKLDVRRVYSDDD